jgi:hypothetical protein
MPVSLTRSGAGDVAVIGLDREASIRFLCRSLTDGVAFIGYPAVLIDLRHTGPLRPQTRQAIADTAQVCLTRRQLVAVVEPGEHVRHAVARARQGRRLLRRPTAVPTRTVRVAAAVLTALARGAGTMARQPGRARAQDPH